MYVESSEITAQGSWLSSRLVRCDILVLDAELRPSLAAIRSLGRRNLRVAGLCVDDVSSVPAFSSRWCGQKLISRAHEGTPGYLASLEQVVRSASPRVIMASSIGTVSLLRQYREQLEKYAPIALAPEAVLDIALNRAHVLEIARTYQLNIPKVFAINDVTEVDEAMRVIGLPAIVKPIVSWDVQRCVRLRTTVVATPEEARSRVHSLIDLGNGALFQQFLPGLQESISFLFARGEVCARFASQTKRTSAQAGRTDVWRRSIRVPEDSGAQAEQLLRQIGLDGYCRVDFRRDYTGKPYLMDIDPCLSTGTELAIHAGVDFPYLLYQWAMGEPVAQVSGYRAGIWRRDLAGDFSAMLATISQAGRPYTMPRGRAIRDFCGAFFVPTSYDYLDWRDPAPAWAAIKGRFNNLRGRIRRGRAKDEA